MILTFTKIPTATTEASLRATYDKIGAIKCVRNWCGLGLKEAKEAIEHCVETGEVELTIDPSAKPHFDIYAFDKAMKIAGGFRVTSSYTELTETIEKAIGIAVRLKEYDIVTALITTLPPSRQ